MTTTSVLSQSTPQYHLSPGVEMDICIDHLRLTGALQTVMEPVVLHELEYSGEDASMSPRLQFQHHPQHSQPITQFPNSNTNPNSLVQTTVGPSPRPGHSDQSRDLVFSNALSSPVRRGLQPFHLAESGYFSSVLPPSNGASGNNETSSHQNRESNSHSSNDSSMDMHTESPTRGSY